MKHAAADEIQTIVESLCNAFYRLVLGPTMTYSCGYFPESGTTLDKAQELKDELICRALAPAPAPPAPAGRLLNHAISRPAGEGALDRDSFPARYVFPDGQSRMPATPAGLVIPTTGTADGRSDPRVLDHHAHGPRSGEPPQSLRRRSRSPRCDPGEADSARARSKTS